MNSTDQALLSWLQAQINTGQKTISVPSCLMESATSEGLDETRRLAALCGCELMVTD
ncbi:MAG: hypothetical protein WCO26_19600 [Deltaproteobacteria bacterium]